MSYLLDYGVGTYWPKLGDTLVYHSAFMHLREVTWIHKQPIPVVKPDTWKQIGRMYDGYTLEVVYPGFTRSDKNFMYEMAKLGMPMARPDFRYMTCVPYEPYVTCQLNSSHPTGARDITMDEVNEHAGPYRVINLDHVRRDRSSITRLLNLVAGAQMHIGPDSGCAWAALAVGTPVTLLRTPEERLTKKEYMMHQCALSLMSIQAGITFI